MSEERGRESDDHQRDKRVEHQAAPMPLQGAFAPDQVPAYPTALLGDPRLDGRGNNPVRVSVMHQAQRTYGNRAVQRYLQRQTATALPMLEEEPLPGGSQPAAEPPTEVQRRAEAVPVQREDPSSPPPASDTPYYKPPDKPLFEYKLDPKFQKDMRLFSLKMRQVLNDELEPLKVKTTLSNVQVPLIPPAPTPGAAPGPGGASGAPAPGGGGAPASPPATTPAQPPAASPSQAAPKGKGPDTPRPATPGDIVAAAVAMPAVDQVINGIKKKAEKAGKQYWNSMSKGTKIAAVSGTAVVGLTGIGVSMADEDTRKMVLTNLSGRTIPVPAAGWLRFEVNTAGENLMLGFHVDVGSLLGEKLGWKPSSPKPIGGPPTPEPFVPGQRAVQRSAGGSDGNGKEDDTAKRIQTKAGGGSSLDRSVKSTLEEGLGADLSGVRVHTDSEADRLARSVDSIAFTSGQDIFFRSGQYNPGSQEGMRLLAHEATHTVQQAQGPVSGTPTAGGVSVSDPSDSFEQAAERAANSVVAGASAAPTGPAQAAASSVQRQPDGEAPAQEQQAVQTMRSPSAPVIQRQAAPGAAHGPTPAAHHHAAAPASVQRKPKGKGSKAKVDVKKPARSTYTLNGKNLEEVAEEIDAREEAGKTAWNPKVTFGRDDDGNVSSVTITVEVTIEMPSWPGVSKRPKAAQEEWKKFYSALEAHEQGHVDLVKAAFTDDLANPMLGKSESEANADFNTAVENLQEASNKFDTATDHGRKAGCEIDTSIDPKPEEAEKESAEGEAGGVTIEPAPVPLQPARTPYAAFPLSVQRQPPGAPSAAGVGKAPDAASLISSKYPNLNLPPDKVAQVQKVFDARFKMQELEKELEKIPYALASARKDAIIKELGELGQTQQTNKIVSVPTEKVLAKDILPKDEKMSAKEVAFRESLYKELISSHMSLYMGDGLAPDPLFTFKWSKNDWVMTHDGGRIGWNNLMSIQKLNLDWQKILVGEQVEITGRMLESVRSMGGKHLDLSGKKLGEIWGYIYNTNVKVGVELSPSGGYYDDARGVVDLYNDMKSKPGAKIVVKAPDNWFHFYALTPNINSYDLTSSMRDGYALLLNKGNQVGGINKIITNDGRGLEPMSTDSGSGWGIKEDMNVYEQFAVGAIMGDAFEDPSVVMIFGQVVIGCIPIVGQIADARDVAVGIHKIWSSGGKDGKLQTALALVGFIPILGDAMKLGKRGVGAVKEALTKAAPSAQKSLAKAILEDADAVAKHFPGLSKAERDALKETLKELPGAGAKALAEGGQAATEYAAKMQKLYGDLGKDAGALVASGGGSWANIVKALAADPTGAGAALGKEMQGWRKAQFAGLNGKVEAKVADLSPDLASAKGKPDAKVTGTDSPLSDVDVSFMGPNAVTHRNAAIRAMEEQYGKKWKDLLDADIFADPTRLHMFEGLGGQAAKNVEKKLVKESELNSLAKMLNSGTELSEVEKIAKDMGVPMAQVTARADEVKKLTTDNLARMLREGAEKSEVEKMAKEAGVKMEDVEKHLASGENIFRELELKMDVLHANFLKETDPLKKAAIAEEMAVTQGKLNAAVQGPYMTPGGAAKHVTRREGLAGAREGEFKPLSPAMGYMALLDDLYMLQHSLPPVGATFDKKTAKAMVKYCDRLLVSAGQNGVSMAQGKAARQLFESVDLLLSRARKDPVKLANEGGTALGSARAALEAQMKELITGVKKNADDYLKTAAPAEKTGIMEAVAKSEKAIMQAIGMLGRLLKAELRADEGENPEPVQPMREVQRTAEVRSQKSEVRNQPLVSEDVQSSSLVPNPSSLHVQRQDPTAPTAPAATTAPAPGSPEARKELEEKEKKALDSARAREGQGAAKVEYSDPRRPPVEVETFKIAKVVERPGWEYPKRYGFDSAGAARAYASTVAGGVGAVVIQQDQFFFAASLAEGAHTLRTTSASITEGDWWSFKAATVWRVSPMSGVVAVIGKDGFVFPNNEIITQSKEKLREDDLKNVAAPPDAPGMRALAGIKEEGGGEAKPGEAPPSPDASTIPPEQEEAFILNYFRSRGLEVLKQNEVMARKLHEQFMPQKPGPENKNSTVSSPAQALINTAREQGPKYRDVLEKEMQLALEVGRVGRSKSVSGGGWEVEFKGKKRYIHEVESELRDEQKKVADNKNEILALSPMLAQMVPAQPPPSEVEQLFWKAYDLGSGVLTPSSEKTREFLWGSKGGKAAYDESLLGKNASDEEVRASYVKKLDDVLKALNKTRGNVIGGDADFLFGMQGLRQRVSADLNRTAGRNTGLKHRLQKMLEDHAVKEMWETIGETVIQLALLFVPGGQFLSAAFGFALQAAEMDKHLKEWDASKATADPATALVDQQKAVNQLLDDTVMMVAAAVDLGQSANQALDALEKGGKKLTDAPSKKQDEATEGPKKTAGDGPVPAAKPYELKPWKPDQVSPEFKTWMRGRGVDVDARVVHHQAVMRGAGNSWEEVKKMMTGFKGASPAEAAAGEYFLMEMAKYRRQVDEGLLKSSIADINAQYKTNYTFEDIVEAVGSDKPTSDLDFSIKGPHAEELVQNFNSRFRKQWGAESAVVFDTNVYTRSAHLDYPIHPDPTNPAKVIEIVPTDPTKPMTTGGKEAWDNFRKETLGKAANTDEKARLTRVMQEAEKLYPNDLGARLRHVHNFEQDVASHITAAEQFLSEGPEGAAKWKKYQEELLAKAPSDKKEALQRVFKEAEWKVKAYQEEVVAKLQQMYPNENFTPEMLAEMAHSKDPAVLDKYMRARNRIYEERLGDLAALKKQYAAATSEAEKLRLAALIQSKQSEALYFASEAYQTSGSILSVVQNAQKAGQKILDPNYGALVASQARAAFFEQYGKAMAYGPDLGGVVKSGKYTERSAYAVMAHPLAGGGSMPGVIGVAKGLDSVKGKSANEVFEFLKKAYPEATDLNHALKLHHSALGAARAELAGKMIEMSGRPLPDVMLVWEQMGKGGNTASALRLINILGQAVQPVDEGGDVGPAQTPAQRMLQRLKEMKRDPYARTDDLLVARRRW